VINHIFSDKTGTITKNELLLRSISFRGNLCSGNSLDEVLSSVNAVNCEEADLLFKCFCICHDVIPMIIEGKSVLSGSSQDELVLLEMAKVCNFYSLEKRDNEEITLKSN
jgi:magnesium-transporting ATPase (P-type)